MLHLMYKNPNTVIKFPKSVVRLSIKNLIKFTTGKFK